MPDESIQLPRNLDVERLMLGALLLSESPEQVLEARAGLPADAFMGQMREIYLTLSDMAERKDSINPVVLATRLAERGSKVEPATIAGLYDGVPRFSNSNLVSEIKILCDLATRRAILRHTENWFVEAQGRDVDVCALIERIKSAAVDLGSVESKKGADELLTDELLVTLRERKAELLELLAIELCPICAAELAENSGKRFRHVWCPRPGQFDAWRALGGRKLSETGAPFIREREKQMDSTQT